MQSQFLDGPAEGVKLALRRAPLYLRVTYQSGEWDALDQLSDVPKAKESVYIYKRLDCARGVHVRASKGSGLGGCWSYGQYRYIGDLPDEISRHTKEWRAWAEDQPTHHWKEGDATGYSRAVQGTDKDREEV